jgi:hypothetical protein
LLILLRTGPYNEVMKRSPTTPVRPDIDAAVRGGDWAQPMDGEGPLGRATLKQALYWSNIYTEILAMEEKVLRRIEQLMASQSAEARHEVQLTNLPVVVAQAERFRQRLGYWNARVAELDGAVSSQAAKGVVKGRKGKASTVTTAHKGAASTGRRQASR